VNNSTANYYFGSKDALYRAVVERALSPMQAIRIKGLENLPANLSRRDGAEALMEAYLGALLRQAATEAGYNYIRIVASLLLVVPDAAAEVIEERLTPVRELYVDKLESLYPEASRSRIYEVLRLAVGLTAMAPIRLGKTRLSKATISRLTHEVVTVSTLAFESLCGAQTQQAN
jgi:AcrR family transcriptional regulator